MHSEEVMDESAYPDDQEEPSSEDGPSSQERPSSREKPLPLSLSKPNHQQSLRDCVEIAVSNYFQHLDGQEVSDVYDMVLSEVEAPLLKLVMKYTHHNQTKASAILGLNRATLRKKLKKYGLS